MGIYVWGTGCGASLLIENGLAVEKITAFVDSNPMGASFLEKPVIRPEELDVMDCELMIISTRHSTRLRELCLSLGLTDDRLFFLKNSHELRDMNSACTTAEHLLGTELYRKLSPRARLISPHPSAVFTDGILEDNDYVRLATLELICRRLKPVPGAAAELGVYKGGFARCINTLIPERTLYLFDSFRGFAESDGASETFQAAHRNTTAKKVLSIMPHPENVRLMPGFFPDSINGLEESFCLVSLDVDFYDCTLAGLEYFWPRLVPGGYLLLHDWSNQSLPGVSQALSHYEEKLGSWLPSVPLPDISGTLVLIKS